MIPRSTLFSLALAFILGACGQPTADSTLDAIIPTDPQNTLDLGKGLDTLSSEVKGDCVVRQQPETVFASNGKSIRMTIEKIESSQDLFQKLDFSAEGSYGYMASGKAKFAKSLKVNDYSIYVLGKINVQLMTEAMRDVELKADAFNLAEDSFPRFLERCGNEFVIGRTTGGEMFLMLEIKTKSREEKQRIEASIQGSFGLSSASAEFASNLENIMKNNSTNFVLYQDGGVYDKANLTVDDVIRKILDFPDKVTLQSGWPISVTTVKYLTLPLPVIDNPYDLAFRQEVLADYQKLSLAYEDYKNNIEYLLANASQFPGLDSVVWNQRLIAINDTLTQISRQASNCYNLTRSCAYNSSIPYPNEAELPARVERLETRGCMDNNGWNHVKGATTADPCDFRMSAKITFKAKTTTFIAPTLIRNLTKTVDYNVWAKTSQEALQLCTSFHRTLSETQTIGSVRVTLKADTVDCTFKSPLVSGVFIPPLKRF